ncbi:MAG: VOC family protein [bacterium]|nr:VOC family protein [bacterium]
MKIKKQNLTFDHIATVNGANDGSLERTVSLFKLLGFTSNMYDRAKGVGEDRPDGTKMRTIVVARDHVKIALMEGMDGRSTDGKPIASQITEYFRRFGVCVQHIAIRCNDLQALVQELHKRGIRFITQYENGKPQILVSEDEEEGTVLQCFTFPVEGTFFFELKQVIKKRGAKNIQEFRDANVKGLWSSIKEAIDQGWLFNVNIRGEKIKSTRAYSHPELAAYIKKLVAGNPLWESEVEYITRVAVEKTKHEMLNAGTLIKKENRLELPLPPVKNKIKGG